MAYTIEHKISSNALSNTYDIFDCLNAHYNMTEYYTERITDEACSVLTEQKYLNLYKGLWTLKNLSLAHIPNIVGVEDSNGIFVIWEGFFGMPLRDYIEVSQKPVSYKTILNVTSPLLDDCETASQNGVYFSVPPESLYLTLGGELKLNAMASPAADIHSTNRDFAQAIFYMLVGAPYGNLSGSVDEYIPKHLNALLEDAMLGRKLFSGIGEFHNRLRAAIRADEAEERQAARHRGFWGGKKMAVVGAGFIAVFTLVLIFIAARIVVAMVSAAF